MNKYSILALLIFFTLISCKKDRARENAAPSDFTTCNCSLKNDEGGAAGAGEYLKANIIGVQVCADIKGNFGNSFDNMFMYGLIKRPSGDTYYDNVHMIRYTSDGKYMMAIFMENTHLLTKKFPYELPRSNPEFCEIGSFQLENQQKITPNMCSTCPDNYWHYYGSFFPTQLRFTADKFENGFFEGRFEGTISTGSGKNAMVRDGRFRIRLAMINSDVVVP